MQKHIIDRSLYVQKIGSSSVVSDISEHDVNAILDPIRNKDNVYVLVRPGVAFLCYPPPPKLLPPGNNKTCFRLTPGIIKTVPKYPLVLILPGGGVTFNRFNITPFCLLGEYRPNCNIIHFRDGFNFANEILIYFNFIWHYKSAF